MTKTPDTTADPYTHLPKKLRAGQTIEIVHQDGKEEYHAIWTPQRCGKRYSDYTNKLSQEEIDNLARGCNAHDMLYDAVVVFSSNFAWREDGLAFSGVLRVVDVRDIDYLQENYPEYLI